MTATPSFFAADLTVSGTVTGHGRLDVDGAVEGDVVVRELAVSATGSVTGNARADAASLSGRLVGTIRARTVTIAASGHLSGLVEYETLGIAPGGVFEAECRPTTAPALEAERAAAAPAPASRVRRALAGATVS